MEENGFLDQCACIALVARLGLHVLKDCSVLSMWDRNLTFSADLEWCGITNKVMLFY
jgi:hypothetical protein